MTEDEARARARELAARDPAHRYLARRGEASGEWSVVRVGLPGRSAGTPTTLDAEPAPRDDPRSASEQNVPPYAAGGG